MMDKYRKPVKEHWPGFKDSELFVKLYKEKRDGKKKINDAISGYFISEFERKPKSDEPGDNR